MHKSAIMKPTNICKQESIHRPICYFSTPICHCCCFELESRQRVFIYTLSSLTTVIMNGETEHVFPHDKLGTLLLMIINCCTLLRVPGPAALLRLSWKLCLESIQLTFVRRISSIHQRQRVKALGLQLLSSRCEMIGNCTNRVISKREGAGKIKVKLSKLEQRKTEI